MRLALNDIDHCPGHLRAALVPTSSCMVDEVNALRIVNGERTNEPFNRLESGTGSGILKASQSATSLQSTRIKGQVNRGILANWAADS